MTTTAVIECLNCGGLQLALADKKTKTCSFCNSRIDLHRAKRLAWAENAAEASEMLKRIKAERRDNAHNPEKKQNKKVPVNR